VHPLLVRIRRHRDARLKNPVVAVPDGLHLFEEGLM
jgi:hypothetical protein